MIVDLLDQLKRERVPVEGGGRAGVIFPASSGLMKVNERRKVIKIADGSVLFEDFDQFILLFSRCLQDASLASSESFCCEPGK